jgi:hypothetical protein
MQKEDGTMRTRTVFGLIMVCLAVLLSTDVYAGAVLKLGIDSGGQHTVTVSGVSATTDVNDGASIAFETYSESNKNLDFGLGIEFQAPREQTLYPGMFNFIPIYGLMRLHPEMSDLTPYLTMQLGFAIFNGDVDYKGSATLIPGGHAGIGGGVIMDKNFQFEILATVDSGSVELGGVTVSDVQYSKVTFSIGFSF